MILTAVYWGQAPKHRCGVDNPEQFGCFGHHTETPWWGLKCWECFGEGTTRGERCGACNGSGLVGMTQCPNSANTRTMDLVFDSWRWLKDNNVLPMPGGLMAQSSTFVSACDFLNIASSVFETDAQRQAHQRATNGTK